MLTGLERLLYLVDPHLMQSLMRPFCPPPAALSSVQVRSDLLQREMRAAHEQLRKHRWEAFGAKDGVQCC